MSKDKIVNLLRDKLCQINCEKCESNYDENPDDCDDCGGEDRLQWEISKELCNQIADEILGNC